MKNLTHIIKKDKSDCSYVEKSIPMTLKETVRELQSISILGNDVQFFNRDFLTYIDKKYLKKFKKRLANLYVYKKGIVRNNFGNKIKVDTNQSRSGQKIKSSYQSATNWYNSETHGRQALKVEALVHSKKTLRMGLQILFAIKLDWFKDRTESWEEKEVREKCWRAVTSLGGNF